ncbi:MAG: hypothetical protein OEY18_06035 [Candidatus Aminicenantes bacterium]|nr:hypothetical protein [Candidatus Aminicenantes bacterium]MDH5743232.1 hypothetical protein [Candidatus Aminicenantes bacterium]
MWIIKTGLIILLLTLAVAFCACADSQQITSDSESTSEPINLSDLFSRLVPQGWAIYDQVGQFTADNLYERINGRAELYLAYDVVSLTTATFEDKTDIGRFIELSVFDMGNPTNAFGIFSVERFQGDPPLDLGRMSYHSGSNAYIWKGKYYITIVASDSTEEFKQISLDLASKVTAALIDSGERVWGLSAFPQDHLITDSVQYFKVDALGLDFMQNTYTAEYLKGETTFKAFLSQQASSGVALDLVERYAEYSQEYGKGFKRTIKNGAEFVLCDMGGTFDVIFRKGRIVSGVISANTQVRAMEIAYDLWVQLQLD